MVALVPKTAMAAQAVAAVIPARAVIVTQEAPLEIKVATTVRVAVMRAETKVVLAVVVVAIVVVPTEIIPAPTVAEVVVVVVDLVLQQPL